MADSDDVIAHPKYQEYGYATYGEEIPSGIKIAKSEDAFRVYGYDTTYGYVHEVTLESCVAERMRDSYATGDMQGMLVLTNCESWACENGIQPAHPLSGTASNIIVDCRGDAVNGPLLQFRMAGDNVTASVDLAGTNAPTGWWPVALISGDNNHVTLTRSAPDGLYSSNRYINCSQHWREWRHRPNDNIDESTTGSNVASDMTHSSIDNQTGLPVVLGANASGNTVTSEGGIIFKNLNNSYSGTVWVPSPIQVTDTWGTYPVWGGTLAITPSLFLNQAPSEKTIVDWLLEL